MNGIRELIVPATPLFTLIYKEGYVKLAPVPAALQSADRPFILNL